MEVMFLPNSVNIEIHGFGLVKEDGLIALYAHDTTLWDIRDKIFSLLAAKSYSDYVVVTVCPTIVWDKRHMDQQFLRVYDSYPGRCQEIARELNETLNMEVEFLPLAGYLPKPEK